MSNRVRRTWCLSSLVASLVATAGLLVLPARSLAAATDDPAFSTVQWNGALYVFWRGADDGLWEQYADSSGWHAATEVPGTAGDLRSAPSAMEWSRDSQLYVFWRGSDNGLWQAWTINGAWSGLNNEIGSAGNDVLTAPGAIEWSRQTYVFWRGPDAGLWEAWTASSGWDGPVQDAGSATRMGTTTPVAVPVPIPTLSPRRGSRRRRLVMVKLTITWTWSTSSSILDRAVLRSRLPRAATMTVACSGRGCPRFPRTFRGGRPSRILRSLSGVRFRPGDRLFITISAPTRTPERIEARIRGTGLPRLSLLNR